MLGISFREGMSGSTIDGAASPEAAEAGGPGPRREFSFDLQVAIPDLRAYLDDGVHEATVLGGVVQWQGRARAGTAVAADGSIVMYRNVSADGRRKAFDFTFSFLDDAGGRITCTGEKRLYDDAGFDAATDLSTLYVTMFDGSGQPIAAGITRVHLSSLFDQVASMQPTGAATPADGAKARAEFFTFMNRQLSQIYAHLPFLFRVDRERYLSPLQWRTLSLITSVMLPSPLPAGGPTTTDVVANLESFVRNAGPAELHDVRRWLDLAGLVEPIARGFLPAIRTFAEQTLASDGHDRLKAAFDMLQKMAVFPYYAHPKADALVGYKRPVFTPKFGTTLPITARPGAVAYDVAIVGAGVAGSLLADRLTAAGKSVIILEAGPYLAERDMSTDELAMTARLYKSAGLQTANEGTPVADESGTLTILQGTCVGGGGTVNNAICFQLPERRMSAWHAAGFPISSADMRTAYLATADELSIKPVSQVAAFVNPAGRFLGALGPAGTPSVETPPKAGLNQCLVNLADCEGLGLCNSGCGSERKVNALQVHLPRALQRNCTLVARARVVDLKLHTAQPGQPRSVHAVVAEIDGERFDVLAGEVILAAGAIASSALLLLADEVRGEIERMGLPVGRRFTANVGSPVFAFFDQVIHQRPSLQISHYYLPDQHNDGFVIESWFAPPGSLAVVMPGYFEDHWNRMLSYSRCITSAPLVGTRPTGTVSIDANRRPQVALPLGDVEVDGLRRGIGLLARTFLAGGDIKPIEVLAGTRHGRAMRTFADVDAFERELTSAAQLRIGTGHPQGGNAMSTDTRISVVDEQFRVRGFANLRVCDASVFPEVAGVNPQWTVLAVAHHCGRVMTGG